MPESNSPGSMIVVNTSPLLALGTCDRIDLLQSLYDYVVIPDAVAHELSRGGTTALPRGLPEGRFDWLKVLKLSNPIPAHLLERLDEGEAAVIALALETGARRVVMDERLGRQVAKSTGLEVIGSMGILLQAKAAGLITTVKPCIEAMQRHNIRLGESLVTQTIQLAGEVVES